MPTDSGSGLRLLAGNALVAALYWGLAYLVALFFSSYGLFPAPLWPSASIALAAALIGGPRLYAGIFLGSLSANYFLFEPPLWVAALVSAGNVLGPAWAARRLHRHCDDPFAFEGFNDVIRFVLFGVALHGVVVASFGVTAAWLGGVLSAEVVPSAWLRWGLADAVGTLLFAPALLQWWRDPHYRPGEREPGMVVAALLTLGLALAIFFSIAAHEHPFAGLPYLLISPLMWLTVRFTLRGANTLQSLVAVIAVTATVMGRGPFNLLGEQRPLVTMGLFVVSLSLTILMVGALMAERRRIRDALAVANASLERRVAERTRELERVNRDKDHFFSIVAHDLRGPLSSFSRLAELVAHDREMEEERRREIAAQLHLSGERVYGLLENLLDWSRMQMGALPFQPQAVALADAIHEPLSHIEPQALAKGVRLGSGSLPGVVRVDARMLATVLRNLLSNGVKFTPAGGEVRVESAVGEGWVEIRVRDTGIGMGAATLATLFGEELVGGTPGTRNEPGAGLGLRLCRQLVERNGGTIRADSAAGAGSTFIVRLPAAEGRAE